MLAENAQEHQVHILLKSKAATYVLSTKKKRRHELANIQGPQYVGAGFTLEVNRKLLKKGKYQLGILIAQNQEIKGFELLSKDFEN